MNDGGLVRDQTRHQSLAETAMHALIISSGRNVNDIEHSMYEIGRLARTQASIMLAEEERCPVLPRMDTARKDKCPTPSPARMLSELLEFECGSSSKSYGTRPLYAWETELLKDIRARRSYEQWARESIALQNIYHEVLG